MKIILDEDTPAPLRRHLTGHDVTTVPMMGWPGVKNGALLALIQDGGFQAFVTCDQNLQFQQTLSVFPFAVVVLRVPNKKRETILPLVPNLLALFPMTKPGQVYVVEAESPPESIKP